MRLFGRLATFSALASYALALNEIIVKGNKFFDGETGDQFFIIGLAYQPGHSGDIKDPLADPEVCSRDIEYFKQLGLNAIRVYEIDPEKDHDACMKLLEDAGIYLILDLSSRDISINRSNPRYTLDVYNRYKNVVNSFMNYTNVLAFIAGNEVSDDPSNTNASPFVKAALRDIKAFVRDNAPRAYPVGYATSDHPKIRLALKDYFNCGDDDERADFYGVNIYSWCGKSSFTKSKFKDRTEELANFSIPVFLSEYGCNEVQPRPFTEVQAIYSADMTGVWSGGLAYEYSQETNDYGLVSIDGNSVEPLPDFNNLKAELAKLDRDAIPGTTLDAQKDAGTPSTCPASDEHWEASTELPPTPSEDACRCLEESFECLVDQEREGFALDDPSIGEAVDFVCENIDCGDISADGKTGVYGRYSFCPTLTKASWALNAFFVSNDRNPKSCDFKGVAITKTADRPDDAECSDLPPSNQATGPADRSRRGSSSNAQCPAPMWWSGVVVATGTAVFVTAVTSLGA